MADKSEAIEKAVVTLHQLSEDKKIKLQCEARERYWMDWQSSMRTNYQKGQAAERANTLKEKERADKEKQRANTEKDRADSEKARADKIEAQKQSMLLEIERLNRVVWEVCVQMSHTPLQYDTTADEFSIDLASSFPLPELDEELPLE